MKKIGLFIIISLLITVPVYSKSINLADPVEVGRVLDIIDGETYKLRIDSGQRKGKEIVVRLIGVDTENNQETYEYVYQELMGKSVFILSDTKNNQFPVSSYSEPVYLYLKLSQSFNVHLVEEGYAKVNDAYSGADQYQELIAGEKGAELYQYGIWNEDGSEDERLSKINLNTASYTELRDYLIDTDTSMASLIVNYRINNPYNTIEEVKFVDDAFDYHWYNSNKDRLSVITNLNRTTEIELRSLIPDFSRSEEYLNTLYNYLLFNEVISLDDIEELDGLKSVFSYFEDFITLDNISTYANDEDFITVNVNTASASELREAAGIESSLSRDIVEYREEEGYIFKNLNELRHIGLGISTDDIARYREHFTTITNVNTASEDELMSLLNLIDASDYTKGLYVDYIIRSRPFTETEELKQIFISSQYTAISPYITVEDSEEMYYNINLTDKDELIDLLDMTSSEARKFESADKNYYDVDDLNFDYEDVVDKFSFYTNINTASREVIYSLHSSMTYSLVEEIIEFREEQPFTSLSELGDFFEEEDAKFIFNQIDDFIVFY